MNATPSAGRCRNCGYFHNDPQFLETAIKGLNAMSSAWGSVRAEDGLCQRHDRYLTADSGCADFTLRAAPARAGGPSV
jgi:hypothetical protein